MFIHTDHPTVAVGLVFRSVAGVVRCGGDTVRETERKYDLDEDASLPRWTTLSGVQDAVGPEEQLLEAVYFDTADYRLAAVGVTLRRRLGGSDGGWHLKLPVGVDRRDEIRVGVHPGRGPAPEPATPAELVALTRAFTRGTPLEPVAELTTHLRRWRLTDERGRDLVEVVDDHVTAQTMGATTEARSWREVEVELGDHGDPALLDHQRSDSALIPVWRDVSKAARHRSLH